MRLRVCLRHRWRQRHNSMLLQDILTNIDTYDTLRNHLRPRITDMCGDLTPRTLDHTFTNQNSRILFEAIYLDIRSFQGLVGLSESFDLFEQCIDSVLEPVVQLHLSSHKNALMYGAASLDRVRQHPRACSGPAPPAAAARCRRALGRPPLPARPARQAPVAHPLAVMLASSVYKERVMVRPVGHQLPAKIAAHRGAAGVVGQRILVSGGGAAQTHNFDPRHRY